jgi:hypothetical protein
MKLDREPEIVRMAYELKADLSAGAVAGIIQVCQRKLRLWIRESGQSVLSVADLERLACKKLRLAFEEVWTDSDLLAVIKKYVAMGEPVFAALKADLNAQTFAALLERHNVTATSSERYVAVIDCRGEKAHRRFFTKWHEIAHLLTLTRQLELPFHRSTTDRSPIERLMDAIAGEIGFPDEAMRQALKAECAVTGVLTFGGVERVRHQVCPEASFHSTLNACVARWPKPVMLIEAGVSWKKTELRSIGSPQLRLIPRDTPEQKLRVLTMVSNEAARSARFRIDPYMEVPRDSAVKHAYEATERTEEVLEDGSSIEDLGIWKHSDGTSVGVGRVRVHTRNFRGKVMALIQPSGRH